MSKSVRVLLTFTLLSAIITGQALAGPGSGPRSSGDPEIPNHPLRITAHVPQFVGTSPSESAFDGRGESRTGSVRLNHWITLVIRVSRLIAR